MQEIIIAVIMAGCLVWVARRIYQIISASKRNESACGCCSCGCNKRKKETCCEEAEENKRVNCEKSCPK